jgi:hypothetical protein
VAERFVSRQSAARLELQETLKQVDRFTGSARKESSEVLLWIASQLSELYFRLR